MGEGREDIDRRPRRAGTEPGLGAAAPASGHAPVGTAKDDGPEAVDFDALHAALGDPLELDELPPAAIECEDEALLEGVEERVGESSGATNAAYASTRPRTIPPSYAPTEDLNAPPVIVASEDTVPSAPPNMTVPVAHPHALGHTPQSGVPFIAGPPASNPAGRAPSGPQHIGQPISGPHPNAPPAYPGVPAANQRGAPQMTMRMPERPLVPGALNPRRGKTPTLVVRPRGPSNKQKLVAFMAMLLLVTACGIAVIVWRKPRWLGLDAPAPPAPSAAVPVPMTTVGPADPTAGIVPTSVPSAPPAPPAPSASGASGASAASASVAPKPRPRPPAPPAPPASALLPRQ